MLATIPPDSLTATPQPNSATGPADTNATSLAGCAEPGRHELALAAQAYLAQRRAGVPPRELGEAWEEFHRAFAPVVARLARRGGAGGGDIQDWTQEIWHCLLRHMDSFRADPAGPPFDAWLTVVARRRLARLRRAAAGRPIEAAGDRLPGFQQEREPDPALACERADDRAQAARLLERLRGRVSPLGYQILELRVLQGQPTAQVGRRLGLTPDQVRMHLHRTILRLRRLAGIGAGEKSR